MESINSITLGERVDLYTGTSEVVQCGIGAVMLLCSTTLATGYAQQPYLPTDMSLQVISSAASVEASFKSLVAKWRDERAKSPTSDLSKILMLRPYQEIIGLGPEAVPFILKEYQLRPHHWWWALEMITRENPATPQMKGDLQAIRMAWLDWGKQRGHID